MVQQTVSLSKIVTTDIPCHIDGTAH